LISISKITFKSWWTRVFLQKTLKKAPKWKIYSYFQKYLSTQNNETYYYRFDFIVQHKTYFFLIYSYRMLHKTNVCTYIMTYVIIIILCHNNIVVYTRDGQKTSMFRFEKFKFFFVCIILVWSIQKSSYSRYTLYSYNRD
jgi:hypothetical protein